MLDQKAKKEMREDALSKKRQKAFEKADKRAGEFIQKNWPRLSVDETIEFLMKAQDITGHFPVSRKIPTPPYDFRL